MLCVSEDPGVYKARASAGEYQILVDEDSNRSIHPEYNMARCGEAMAFGPDEHGPGLHFVVGSPDYDGVFEIVLNLAERDARRIVTSKRLECYELSSANGALDAATKVMNW